MLRLLLAVVVLGASAALACECRAADPSRDFQTTDAVFEATVEAILFDAAAGSDVRVKVTVGRRWKGLASSGPLELRVNGGKACGYQFKEKTSYLVFAMKGGDALRVTLCGATQPLADAKAALEKLPPPSK